MGHDVRKLSIHTIRARYVQGDEPVTRQLLTKLRRDPRQGVRRLHDVLLRRYEREREERLRLDAMLNFERVLWRSGIRHVAGVDESGMAPLAGPIVAAAVVFPPGTEIEGVDDCKRLEPERRSALEAAIRARATAVGIGLAEVREIDELNPHHAGLLAMRRAVQDLSVTPEHVLVDARHIPDIDVPQNAFQRGDGIDFSVAAASIVAKTYRDRLMQELDERYPGYGLGRHKGYPTPEHQARIRELGPCPIHRSYTYLREIRGELRPRFYELQARIRDTGSASELAAAEDELAAARDGLDPYEVRKLRSLVLRRYERLP